MPGKKGKNRFQQRWLSIDSADYIDWLSASSKGDSMAYCKLCRRDFTIENMGKAAITSHGKSKKHVAYSSAQKNSISLKSVFASRSNNSESVVQVSNWGADEASTSAQQEPTTSAQEAFTTVQGTPNTTIHRFLLKEEVTKAEILWSIYSVLSYSSKRAAASAAEGFPSMFPDSEIAKKFTCAKDKIGYLVTFGLASHFIDELKQTINGIPFFTILFDESMNKIAQRGQMDLHIRFCMNDIVRTRYLTSVFMGRARAEDLLKCFHDGTAGLDQDKILHISMDGPNVNKKFLELYKSSRDEDMHKLNELGSCSLHVICGSLKNADEKTVGFRVGTFLMAVYYVFKDSPARRAMLLTYNGVSSCDFPLKFCSTRWVENVRVSLRAVSLIPFLIKFVKGVTDDKKRPTSKSFETMETALKDPFLSAKLAFFQRVASILETFLKSYQTDSPMVPFMFSDVTKIMTELLSIVVKPDILNGKTGMDLCKINIRNSNNLLDVAVIELGFGVAEQIKLATARYGPFQKKSILNFRTDCQSFVVTIIEKLQAKNPISYKMVVGASCLDPKVMSSVILRKLRAKAALDEFVSRKWMTGFQADILINEYMEFCEEPSTKKKLAEYNRMDRLDTFLFKLMLDNPVSKDFRCFASMIFCFSHGQASVERGFNINKEILVENMKERSLIANRLVQDVVYQTVGKKWYEFPISKPLISSVRLARQRRQDALDAEANEKNKEEKAAAESRASSALMKVKEQEMKKKRADLEQQLVLLNAEEQVLKKMKITKSEC